MIRLEPNFIRVVLKSMIPGGIVLVWGFVADKSHPLEYNFSLSLFTVVVLSVMAWLMFTPRLLQYSETEITIVTWLGKSTYRWADLYCYGRGNGVFVIKFEGDRQAYQIYSGAYAAWPAFVQFLKTNFPERESNGFSIGTRMWPKGK